MKAVNLIPTDARRGGSSVAAQAPTYLILGVLAVALAFVTVYVLTSNSIADRTAKLSSLQARIAQTQAQASNLVDYTQFAQLVQQRAQTVKTIATGRFDWHTSLIDLSQVVPTNTSLQSLQAGLGSGSAASGTSTSASGSAGGALLGSANGPAIELSGCTGSQDDVARLMSRLRLIAGVTRVTLANSQKPAEGGSTASSAQGAVGCGSNAPTFDLLVALTPMSGSSAAGAAAGSSATPSSTTTTTTPGGTASPSTATGASGTNTNTAATATTSTTSATSGSSPTTTTGGS